MILIFLHLFVNHLLPPPWSDFLLLYLYNAGLEKYIRLSGLEIPWQILQLMDKWQMFLYIFHLIIRNHSKMACQVKTGMIGLILWWRRWSCWLIRMFFWAGSLSQRQASHRQYLTKLNTKKTIDKRKARLVAKGFLQSKVIDLDETYSPSSKQETIHMVLTQMILNNWESKQMDTMTVFLNSILQHGMHLKQPEGFVDSKNSEYIKSFSLQTLSSSTWIALDSCFQVP